MDAQVDARWYLEQYPDVATSGVDARTHFRRFGRLEGRLPNPLSEQLDREWYTRRYPDVTAQGIDPLVHFLLHGHSEGRRGSARLRSLPFFPASPNDQEAAYTVTGSPHKAVVANVPSDFDPQWYRLRNPELADSALDPLQHYIGIGRAEGRSRNSTVEPREVWSDRFDAAWYVARNLDLNGYDDDPLGHFLRVGLVEGRAPNSGEENRSIWAKIFDPKWYLDHNPDVKAAGLDPLEHYINEGLRERRKPNASWLIPSRPITDACLTQIKEGVLGAEIALLVTHSWNGRIKPHVEAHLESFKREGISTVLIIASDAESTSAGHKSAAADVIYHRENMGFDFAAWAHVLKERCELVSAETLVLCNDSVFGPIDAKAFTKVVSRVRRSPADLVGLTDNSDRGWHPQSYFLAIKRRLVRSTEFRNFLSSIVSYQNKDDVINEYETQFGRQMIKYGFSCDVLFPTVSRRNETVFSWDKLLDRGFPYIKVSVFRGLHQDVNSKGWRERATSLGYDVQLVDSTLAYFAADLRQARYQTHSGA